jgi:hypothetical protein
MSALKIKQLANNLPRKGRLKKHFKYIGKNPSPEGRVGRGW